MSLSVCKEAGNSRDDGGNEMVIQKSYQNQGRNARNNVKINTHTHTNPSIRSMFTLVMDLNSAKSTLYAIAKPQQTYWGENAATFCYRSSSVLWTLLLLTNISRDFHYAKVMKIFKLFY